MLIATYDYWGYYNVCFLGDEIKEPTKNIPRALLLSIVLVACLYIAALSMKRISNAGDADDIPPPPPTKRHRTKHDSSGSFMERMEDRWRRRRDEDL